MPRSIHCLRTIFTSMAEQFCIALTWRPAKPACRGQPVRPTRLSCPCRSGPQIEGMDVMTRPASRALTPETTGNTRGKVVIRGRRSRAGGFARHMTPWSLSYRANSRSPGSCGEFGREGISGSDERACGTARMLLAERREMMERSMAIRSDGNALEMCFLGYRSRQVAREQERPASRRVV